MAQIDQLGRISRVLRALAEHSRQLVNCSGVGAAFNLKRVTAAPHGVLLTPTESLFGEDFAAVPLSALWA